ncbi:MAG: ATP-binding protein [Bacteroidota bacterium]
MPARISGSEKKYQGVMEQLELGLLEIDTQGKITKAYQYFCHMTGYSQEELVGKRARDLLVPKEFIATLEAQDEKQRRGERGLYEVQIIAKNGDRIWVLVTSAPLIDGEGRLTGYLDIIYDMTSRKLLEQELKVAKDQAERSREAEKQFLANMSHEIRNAIIGISNLLYDTELTKEQLGHVDNIKYSGDMLLGLISGILDLSKIESGAMDLVEKNIDIHSTLQAIIHTMSFKAKQKPITFSYERDERINFRVMADRVVLNQIFSNLLVNAEKFTDRGSIKVRSTLIGTKEGKAHLSFSVTDTGIGIPRNKLGKIFKSFEQADRETKLRYGGTGLGLAIVKQLVSKYGGGVSVTSREKKGSTFRFDLYLRMAEEIEAVNRSFTYKPFEESRILIDEDNPVNQQYLSGILEKWFLSYDLANNGIEALELLGEHKYQLVLMDIRMPEMDGYETTIRIRSSEDNPNTNIPIIALTASALVDEKERALAAGMNYHLTKPFSPEDLGLVLSKFNLIEAVEVDKPENFTFNSELDADYLDEFYQGDLQRAALMFDIFLKVIDGEMDKLQQLKEEQDWNGFSSQAHKIKPNFMMVGLRDFSEKMKYFEGAKKYADLRKMISLQFDEVRRDFDTSKTLIEKELVRLREFT